MRIMDRFAHPNADMWRLNSERAFNAEAQRLRKVLTKEYEGSAGESENPNSLWKQSQGKPERTQWWGSLNKGRPTQVMMREEEAGSNPHCETQRTTVTKIKQEVRHDRQERERLSWSTDHTEHDGCKKQPRKTRNLFAFPNQSNLKSFSSDDKNDRLHPFKARTAGGNGPPSWGPGQDQLSAAGEERQHLCTRRLVENV